MCHVLAVPVRVDAYEKGNDGKPLGKGFIRGTTSLRVAWIDGDIVAVTEAEKFTPEEEFQLAKRGATFGSLTDVPVIVLDNNNEVHYGPWTDTEYVFDEVSK